MADQTICALQEENSALKRHAERHKSGRLQAEKILEQKSYELFTSNENLKKVVLELDKRVAHRTSELTAAKDFAENNALKLEKSNQRFELVLDASNAGIWEKNLTTNEWYCSQRLAMMLDTSVSDVVERLEHGSLLLGNENQKFTHLFEGDVTEDTTININCQMVMGDGSSRWFRLNASTEFDRNGKALWAAGAFVDINELQETTRLIKHIATHDSLTKIPNRDLFNTELKSTLKDAMTTGKIFSLIMLDLNNFKDVNDEFGHQAGDHLLHHVAESIQLTLRKADTVARLGGDEFAILLTNVNDKVSVKSICNNILQACEKPTIYEDVALSITVSMGVALFVGRDETPSSLLKNADLAMYFAKKQRVSGSAVHFFTSDMDISIRKARESKQQIKRAIVNEEFILHYQPKYDIGTSTMQGVEALIRWPQADGTLTPPDQFIPQSEEGGMIDSLGQWVIEQSCRQAGKWKRDDLNIKVAINLSPLQFASQNLPGIFSNAISRNNLSGDMLEVEITESCILENIEGVSRQLHALREMGIVVSLDDFGTGYASFTYLHQLPIQIVKIDQTFIAELGTDQESMSIVDAIIKLSHSLGKTVTAEGVETVEQLRWLKSKKCDVAQGFYFSKPLIPQKIEELMRTINANHNFSVLN